MEFFDEGGYIGSKDPWQYMRFEKGSDIVELDGSFSIAELKQILFRCEFYRIDLK